MADQTSDVDVMDGFSDEGILLVQSPCDSQAGTGHVLPRVEHEGGPSSNTTMACTSHVMDFNVLAAKFESMQLALVCLCPTLAMP